MVRDVADMMRLRAQEKGLRLLLDQSSGFPRYIKGDEARLRQILINLTANAVKFTSHGGVTIRLGLRRDGRPHLLIEVEDTGIGIKPEDQKRLFQPFVQLGEPAAQKGTGLGLTITRQFVELMGGSIGVGEHPRQGLHLPGRAAGGTGGGGATSGPCQRRRKPGEVCGLAPGQPAFRILIAEDQRENQLLLMKLMADIGLNARLAENGKRCVELFQEWQPQLIWMDRRMPVMDGIEATRQIRQLPGGKDVKIVAVTASAFDEQRRKLLDAGMDDFVRKPYRIHEIYDGLARHLGVKYLYRSNLPETEAETPATVTPEMLAVLPAPLRAGLKAALESLDSSLIEEAIAEAGKTDAALANALTQLAGNFSHQAILKALDAEQIDSARGGQAPPQPALV